MSTSSLRAAMVPISRRVRAYFAPVERNTETPTIFDPAKYGKFILETPPSPWLDLGWIDGFQRTPTTGTGVLSAGSSGAPLTQFRSLLNARVDFDFREWGKLQMALACGSQHMNVLAVAPNAEPHPSGGTALSSTAVLAGSTASEVLLGAGAVDAFSIGDMIAVDADYQQQTGYVGTGIAAAFVKSPMDVKQDANYVRRVTFNVGRVAQKTATSLLLAQPLLGGAPTQGMGVQKIAAFLDREGGSFFQEWSALFVAEEESGGRICFHYPRLSPSSGQGNGMQREEVIEISTPLAALALHASFTALPYSDENDGETVVCYRSYFPANASAVY
jgi:hypothetical protein